MSLFSIWKVETSTNLEVNPFIPNAPFLYPPKRGLRKDALEANGLIILRVTGFDLSFWSTAVKMYSFAT